MRNPLFCYSYPLNRRFYTVRHMIVSVKAYSEDTATIQRGYSDFKSPFFHGSELSDNTVFHCFNGYFGLVGNITVTFLPETAQFKNFPVID